MRKNINLRESTKVESQFVNNMVHNKIIELPEHQNKCCFAQKSLCNKHWEVKINTFLL